MNILAIWAARRAALVPGLAVGMPAAVRADGLDGFAFGALLSGACFLLAASPRRPWRALPGRRALLRSAAGVRPAAAGQPPGTRRRGRRAPQPAALGQDRPATGRGAPGAAQARGTAAGLAGRMTGLLPGRAVTGAAMPGGGRD